MAWTSLVRNGTALQLRRGVRDDSGLAYGRFEEQQNATGWNFLWLRTSGLYTDEEQMHAAGYLEGALTARLIPQHYSNWYSRAFKDELEPGDPAGGARARDAELAQQPGMTKWKLLNKIAHEGIRPTMPPAPPPHPTPPRPGYRRRPPCR